MVVSTVCLVLVFILGSTISKNTDVTINVTISSKTDVNNGYSRTSNAGTWKDLLIFNKFKKSIFLELIIFKDLLSNRYHITI